MRIGFREDSGGNERRRMVAETVKECAEDSPRSEIDVAVLKEVMQVKFWEK